MQLQLSVTRTKNGYSKTLLKRESIFSSENRQTGVKGGLNHKKGQDVAKTNKSNYYLKNKEDFQ